MPLIIIILILVGIVFLINQFLKNSTPIEEVSEFENSISIKLQNPNSVAILVQRVSLAKPGFIVIQDVDEETQELNSIWGVSDLLPAGEHKNVSIVMDFEPSQEFFGILYEDDGNGEFNAELDSMIVDEQNEPIPFSNVIFKGSTKGTISDENGHFYLQSNKINLFALKKGI